MEKWSFNGKTNKNIKIWVASCIQKIKVNNFHEKSIVFVYWISNPRIGLQYSLLKVYNHFYYCGKYVIIGENDFIFF